MEQPPKRQKIEEASANAFFAWYVPASAHPKKAASEMKEVWFRFPTAWRLYNSLVRRKWHQRWYLIFIMKLSPHQMYTYELLRGQGVFAAAKKEYFVPAPKEYFEELE